MTAKLNEKLNKELVQFWAPVYDDSDTSSDIGTDAGSNDNPNPNTGTATGIDTGKKSSGAFTAEQQKRIDRIVQERVAKVKATQQAEQQKTIDQLNQLKKTKEMTASERDKLQERIDTLEASYMTKEELAAKTKKEEDLRHETAINTLTQERDDWKKRYTQSTIERAILDAAASKVGENPAINPSQIVTILRGSTNLVEETVDGNGTGKYIPRVKFAGRDSEGKPMEMDLTVPEAIAEMKKMEPEYGNLWESGLTGGVGGNNTPGSGPVSEASLDTQEAYMKNRQKIKDTV